MLAERLKLIRHARGLSLDDLSASMEGLVTKQALSKYETGKDRPSPRVVRALAKALGVAANTLLEEPRQVVETVSFRKAAKLGKKAQAHFDSLLRMRLEQAVGLRELIDPDPCFAVPVLEYSVNSSQDAEGAANKLREYWSLGKDPIPNLVEVLEAAGILVVEVEGEGSFDGLSAIAKNDQGVACGASVMVQQGVCRERQRLTLAHETAHVVLKVQDDVDEENMAFRFAGAFLAPAETLILDVGQHRSRVLLQELKLLRSRYGMSMQAILRRMVDLEIISPAHYRTWYMWFSKTRQRKHEEGQNPVGEEATWLARTVYRALGEGLITRVRAEEILNQSVEDEGEDTFIRHLRRMKPEDRERLFEVQMASIQDVNQGLDTDWMDGIEEEVI